MGRENAPFMANKGELIFDGGPYRNRTYNLLIKSQLLCLVELTAPITSMEDLNIPNNFGIACQFISESSSPFSSGTIGSADQFSVNA